MSIIERIQMTDITEQHKQIILNESATLYQLRQALQKCVWPGEVINYLKVEVEGRNRPSYIDRIYGRYAALQPAVDRANLYVYGDKFNGQKRKRSGDVPQ